MFLNNDSLVVEYLNGDLWELNEDFTYIDDLPKGNGSIIVVPKGFQTDFASVPRPFWGLLSPYENGVGQAGVIHDWLYFRGSVGLQPITRSYADGVFLRVMTELGVSWFRRHAAWGAVRAFSGIAWQNYRTGKNRRKQPHDPLLP